MIAGGERRSCCSRVPRAERAASRFLTREARPNQSNPYVPWRVDPLGALISPLAILALIYGRKRKRSKWDTLVILLVLGGAMGMSLSACKGPTETPSRTPTPTPSPDIPLGTQTSDGSVTITVKPTGDSGQGTPTPSANCTLTLTPTNKPTPTLTDDELFQITAEEIQLAGGIINVLKNEDTSLLLARVAIGEAQDREDERLRIMWLVKVRAELGYSNSVRGVNTSFLDRFGVKSTVERELLEPGEFEVIDYIRENNISNPQLEPDNNIKAMLYPTGEKIDIFRRTYQNAKVIVRFSESDLKNGTDGYLNQIKGYEQYKSPSLLSPQDPYWYFGQPIKYLGSGDTIGLNVWEDVLPVDNYFFGLVTCNQIEQMLEQGIFTDYFWGGRVNCTP